MSGEIKYKSRINQKKDSVTLLVLMTLVATLGGHIGIATHHFYCTCDGVNILDCAY